MRAKKQQLCFNYSRLENNKRHAVLSYALPVFCNFLYFHLSVHRFAPFRSYNSPAAVKTTPRAKQNAPNAKVPIISAPRFLRAS